MLLGQEKCIRKNFTCKCKRGKQVRGGEKQIKEEAQSRASCDEDWCDEEKHIQSRWKRPGRRVKAGQVKVKEDCRRMNQ